jgi:iron complex transport system ATP-binding protein
MTCAVLCKKFLLECKKQLSLFFLKKIICPIVFEHMSENEKILIIDGLSAGYGSGKSEKKVLSEINATAAKGELIAVIGRNGSGKSTLLRSISGLQRYSSGKIYFEDTEISKLSRKQLAQKVGYISTEIVKVHNMSVYDLVALGRFPHTDWTGRIDSENESRILEALSDTGMAEMAARNISELSDGERQRAMITRVLAQDADLMIMDEPTAFLDIVGKHEIFSLLHKIAKENRKTIIFSTHDLQMTLNCADKIWSLNNSELFESTSEDFISTGVFDKIFDSVNIKYGTEYGAFAFKMWYKTTLG